MKCQANVTVLDSGQRMISGIVGLKSWAQEIVIFQQTAAIIDRGDTNVKNFNCDPKFSQNKGLSDLHLGGSSCLLAPCRDAIEPD